MTNEKSPEQMAEEWAKARNPWCKYPRGSGSALVHAQVLAYLAGFQACESTVAQPLREQKEFLTSECYKMARQLHRIEDELDALTQELKATTAENEKLQKDKERLMEMNLKIAEGVQAMNARVSSLTAALEKIDGIRLTGSSYFLEPCDIAKAALTAMEGKAE